MIRGVANVIASIASGSLAIASIVLRALYQQAEKPATLAVLSAVLSGFASIASISAETDETVAKPSSAEIRSLEGRVKLPPKASALRTYVRYYYASADSGAVGRSIEGIYVAKSWFKPSEVPPGDIVVVSAEADVSVPENAKCTVVFVTYTPSNKTAVTSCSLSLILKK
jgi:hypothetical protein